MHTTKHHFLKTLTISFPMIMCSLHTLSITDRGYYIQTALNEKNRNAFALFLDNVLKKPSEKFFDDIKNLYQGNHDTAIYEILYSHSQPRLTMSAKEKYNSLQNQKKIIKKQAQKLLGIDQSINGCVEIGNPGTYLSKMTQTFLKNTGPTYCINETRNKIIDRINTNTVFEYAKFISLNNYDPIAFKAIPNNSVDLVVCFIGLHHCPEHKLEAFANSIARILRPGGTFLLRDHNVNSDEIMTLTHAAHSIFNVILAGETPEAERAEYRNFQPLEYWINLLKTAGFEIGTQRLLQNGDPTQNTMIKCTKKITNPEQLMHLKDYKREVHQTHLTSVEWDSVRLAKDYADFITHTPFYEFPYMKSLRHMWNLYFKSLKLSIQKAGYKKTLLSSYTLMNTFIASFTTTEFLAKSAISLPIRWAFSGEEPETMFAVISDPYNEITQDNKHVKVIQAFDDNRKYVQIPRYRAFLELIHTKKNSSIRFIEIAGNKEIQLTVRQNSQTVNTQGVDGCIKEYESRVPSKPYLTEAALTVEIEKLIDVMKELDNRDIEITDIHDF